jgi:hypothetical protein
MNRTIRWIFALMILLVGASLASADDLTGSDVLLCSPVMANACGPDEGCAQKTPWSLNVPLFIEVDLANRSMKTTEASGLNRATEINNLLREDGLIVLQGYQMRRAFSIVITEETGFLTFSVSGEDRGAVIFGACTPKP